MGDNGLQQSEQEQVDAVHEHVDAVPAQALDAVHEHVDAVPEQVLDSVHEQVLDSVHEQVVEHSEHEHVLADGTHLRHSHAGHGQKIQEAAAASLQQPPSAQ